jgi:DNA-directed RNA polymerase specialized sigma24 family protein
VRWGRRRKWDPDFTDEVAQRTLEEWLFRGLADGLPPPRKFWLRALSHASHILKERLIVLGERDQEVADLRCPQALDRQGDLGPYLQRLPRGEQQILIWVYLEGKDRAEVAQLLHLTEANLRVRLHRARANFRVLLGVESAVLHEDFS